MYLLDPKYDEEGLEDKKDRLESIVESENGEVESIDEWGKKRLAYEIDGFTEGYYLLIKFEAASDSIDGISEKSNVEEDVIKYQIFRRKDVAEPVKS